MTRRSGALALWVLCIGGLPALAQDPNRKAPPDPAAERPLPPVEVPPLAPGEPALRVIAFGDWGTGHPDQRKVADAMARRAEREPIDLLLTLGDNFYPAGVRSADDPQWESKFLKIYDQPSLQVPIYPALGNHDHRGNVQAQVAFGQRQPRWILPAPYHRFTKPLGDAAVEFVVIDTTPIAEDRPGWEEQVRWLDQTLAASAARWKVVTGHHPLYSHSIRGYNQRLIERLEPVFVRHKVDLYLAGHDHTLELHQPVQGVHHAVSGGAGGESMAYAVEWAPETIYAATGGGFLALRISRDALVLEFVRADSRTQFAYTLAKSGPTGPH